jgi:hypothetical protein
MNVLFLDIDGVLVTMKSDYQETPVYDEYHRFSKKSVDLLVEIIKEYNFTVVLSSAWRLFNETYFAVENLLKKFEIKIYDTTPDFETLAGRYLEISEWLDRHPGVEKFIILDDFPMYDLSSNWVRTTMSNGLLPEHRKRIKEIMTA